MHVSIRTVLIAALALAGAQPLLAQDTAGATARQLSKAVLAGVEVAVEEGEAKGRIDPRVGACIRAIDRLAMEPSYRRLLEANFTPAEIAALDAHYGSPIGELDWRTALNTLREQQGLPIREPVTLTEEQRTAMTTFFASDVAIRLNKVTGDPGSEAARMLQADIAKVLEPCR